MGVLYFVATNEGVVTALSEADTWKQVRRGLTTRQVNSLSVEDDIVLAGTKEGIFRSDDKGRTWRIACQGLTEPHIRWLAHHPDGSGKVLAGTRTRSHLSIPGWWADLGGAARGGQVAS